MAKAFYPTNDGHIGNIEKLLMPQLLELIQRQEKLLCKKSFLKTLADKGEKITQHLSVLNEELQRRKQMAKGNVVKNNTNSQTWECNTKVSKDSTVNNTVLEVGVDKVNKVNTQILTNEHGGLVKDTRAESAANSLEKDFEKLKIQDGSADGLTKAKHQYEIAVERAEKNAMESQRSYKRLNRSINVTSVDQLPAKIKASKPSGSHQKKSTKSSLQADESAAVPPRYKYDEVKVITLDESLNLQLAQKQKQEELQAQLAAEKLAQRLNIKLETYNPEGIDMSYRDRKPGSDQIDSDDDDNDEDQTGAGMADLLTSDTED